MDETSDSSESDRDRRDRRHLPHGAFAQALKSSRLHANTSTPFGSIVFGNPKYTTVKNFFCKTGWFLRVDSEGRVNGSRDEGDKRIIIRIVSAGQAGHVHLLGVESDLFIAMDRNGRLYGESNKTNEETVWLEEPLGSYNSYMSRAYAHRGWYLALKKSGKQKRGHRTGWGQKATQFLTKNIYL